jgi:lipopolysaccharide transport system ATP-binding protein
MEMKERGVTILFCSHALFQVEALCPRAVWLHEGGVRFDGPSAQAVVEYQSWLDAQETRDQPPGSGDRFDTPQAALLGVTFADGGTQAHLHSRKDDLVVHVRLRCDPQLPAPTLGIVVHGADGRALASAGSWMDGAVLQPGAGGEADAVLRFPELPLLKGRYTVSAYVLDERSVNVLSAAEHVLHFEVQQDHLERGMVTLPREWRMGPQA